MSQRSVFKVGLTGGIGSGKSAVADFFKQLNVSVIDADVVAREVVEPHTPAFKKIVDYFGQDIVLENGQLNRAHLRQQVFSRSPEAAHHLKWLNALLHPLINQRMQDFYDQQTGHYCIGVIPLLFENQLEHQFHRILVVDIPVELQIERAAKRDSKHREQIEAIIKQQISREKRLAQADDIIDNSGSLDNTQQQVLQKHHYYLSLSGHDSTSAT